MSYFSCTNQLVGNYCTNHQYVGALNKDEKYKCKNICNENLNCNGYFTYQPTTSQWQNHVACYNCIGDNNNPALKNANSINDLHLCNRKELNFSHLPNSVKDQYISKTLYDNCEQQNIRLNSEIDELNEIINTKNKKISNLQKELENNSFNSPLLPENPVPSVSTLPPVTIGPVRPIELPSGTIEPVAPIELSPSETINEIDNCYVCNTDTNNMCVDTKFAFPRNNLSNTKIKNECYKYQQKNKYLGYFVGKVKYDNEEYDGCHVCTTYQVRPYDPSDYTNLDAPVEMCYNVCTDTLPVNNNNNTTTYNN